MLRVLYYNWTDYRSPRGGGVTVYLRNLLTALAENEEIQPFFLSSGDIYSPFSSKPYIRPVPNQNFEDVPAFELVNSPIPAPGALLSQNLRDYLNLSDNSVLELFRKFIADQGGFDIIHFHNLEGVPLNILKIKDYFPQTKIIFTLHNYFPFCPQVQLFQHNNECCCHSFRGGLECGRCRQRKINPDFFTGQMFFWFAEGSLWPQILTPWLKFKSRRLARRLLSANCQRNSPQTYKDFRRLNITFLNRYTDKILAVSKRVREIAEGYGIAPQLLEVAYIGTDYAEMKPPTEQSHKQNTPFTIIFPGYARAAKGFFFLLNALEQLSDQEASQINLRLAARHIDNAVEKKRLERLKLKFNKVEIFDGYRREELPQLLSGVDLGIVPVIWEDNLPQVAIEMAAHGVAVLASDFGGASELSESPYFRFCGNNQEDFISHLLFLKAHREILSDYHRQRRPLTTMPQHIRQLSELYRQTETETFQAAE